jgi:c-di-GMP-binding flagellar brake protein YcgR
MPRGAAAAHCRRAVTIGNSPQDAQRLRPMSAERRHHERKALRVSGQVLIPAQPPMEVRIVDLSRGGMGLVAPINMPAKLVCMVRASLPLRPSGSVVLEVQAKVVHCVLSSAHSGFLAGLQFERLTPAAEAAIKKYLQ